MTARKYKITIIPEQPILVSGSTMGNYRTTLDYLPGSALRGAFAAQLLRDGQIDAFESIFEGSDRAPIFMHAFPTLLDSAVIPRPFPITAVSCKRFPGLRQRKPKEQHGVMDSIIAHLTGEPLICPVCGQDMEGHTGYYIRQDNYQSSEQHQRVSATTHVAINRRRRVAEDGLLYTREGLTFYNPSRPNAQTGVFAGIAWLTDAAKTALDGLTLWIGGNRSRGMGRARIISEPLADDDWEARAALLTDRLSERGAKGQYFTLDTYTPYLPLPGTASAPSIAGATLVQQWVKTEVESGWHAAAGVPRRSVPAVSGCFLYRIKDANAVRADLPALDAQGRGEQTERGYGRFTVCDPLHYDAVKKEV